jgi:hypothetical protein
MSDEDETGIQPGSFRRKLGLSLGLSVLALSVAEEEAERKRRAAVERQKG